MTEKHWEEALGNGVAIYNNCSGKIEMVGYVQHKKNHDARNDRSDKEKAEGR